jgi:hypothetical protein
MIRQETIRYETIRHDLLRHETIRQEQYEVWVQRGEKKWEMLCSFQDLGVASAIAKNRPSRTRLICITYEYGKMISQDLVEELGITPGNA